MSLVEFMTLSRTRQSSRFYPAARYQFEDETIQKLLVLEGFERKPPGRVSSNTKRAIRRAIAKRGGVSVIDSPGTFEQMSAMYQASRGQGSDVLDQVLQDFRCLHAKKECLVISLIAPTA